MYTYVLLEALVKSLVWFLAYSHIIAHSEPCGCLRSNSYVCVGGWVRELFSKMDTISFSYGNRADNIWRRALFDMSVLHLCSSYSSSQYNGLRLMWRFHSYFEPMGEAQGIKRAVKLTTEGVNLFRHFMVQLQYTVHYITYRCCTCNYFIYYDLIYHVHVQCFPYLF